MNLLRYKAIASCLLLPSTVQVNADYIERIPRAPEFPDNFFDEEVLQRAPFSATAINSVTGEVVGNYSLNREVPTRVSRWSFQNGFTAIETPPLISTDFNGFFNPASPDGSGLAANTFDDLSYIWTSSTGWQAVEDNSPTQIADIFGIANNANRACGALEDSGSPFGRVPALWNSDGSLELIPIPEPYSRGAASVISGDGSTVFGDFSQDRSFGAVFRWQDGIGTTLLNAPTNWTSFEIFTSNENGSFALGTANVSSIGEQFFQWDPTEGFEIIPLPDPGVTLTGLGEVFMSSNASLAFLAGFTGRANNFETIWFVWRPEQAVATLDDFCQERGLDSTVFDGAFRFIVSPDGKKVASEGREPISSEIVSLLMHLDNAIPSAEINRVDEEIAIRWPLLKGWELFELTDLATGSQQMITPSSTDFENTAELQGSQGFFQLQESSED